MSGSVARLDSEVPPKGEVPKALPSEAKLTLIDCTVEVLVNSEVAWVEEVKVAKWGSSSRLLALHSAVCARSDMRGPAMEGVLVEEAVQIPVDREESDESRRCCALYHASRVEPPS